MIQEFYWPAGAIAKNAIIGGLSLGLGVFLLVLDPIFIVTLIAILLVGVGIFSLWQTLRHAKSQVILDDEGIRLEGLIRKSIPWSDLDSLELRWLSRRSSVDQQAGIFILHLRGAGKKVTVDSQIHDFSHFLRISVGKAVAEHASMSQSTVGNLEALGLHLDQFIQDV